MDRRDFLALIGSGLSARAAQVAPENPKADITLRISPVEMEIAPRRTIKTIGYNGSVPGPVL
ncbi:MAG: copper oxidase, partial [Bryobacteraceae bacterium]